MSFRRNWFIFLSLNLSLAAIFLILVFGITGFQKDSKSPYFVQTMLIAGFFGIFILMNLLFYLITIPKLVTLFKRMRKASIWLEAFLVLIILGAGLAIRIYFIKNYPVAMESDYKFYFDVASLIHKGTLVTESNNEYICLFPNTYGYAYILSIVIRIFGSKPEIFLYFNMLLSLATSFFCYRIGKMLSGSLCGISALAIVCFWPSQIMYGNINGSEASFTCILFLAILLSIRSLKAKECDKFQSFLTVCLHLTIGVLLAVASAVRPMAIVYLIAFVLCLLTINRKLEYTNINKLSLGTIFLSKGYLRVIFVIMGYFLASQIISAGITNAIQKQIAGSGAMGYSLMVGLDKESDGGYSDKSMKFLYSNYGKTQSANDTNTACMKIAMNEAKEDPKGLLALFAKKFFLVWSNDDYGATTNIVTMNNQGLLTKDREKLFYQLSDLSDLYYLFAVFLAGIGVISLFHKDHKAHVFAVFFTGGVVLHLLVEIQNRYHYYLLQVLGVLAAVGISAVYEKYLHRTSVQTLSDPILLPMERVPELTMESPNSIVADMKKQDDNIHTIDFLKAIQDGHITITAAKVYGDDAKKAKIRADQSVLADQSVIEEVAITVGSEELIGIPEKITETDIVDEKEVRDQILQEEQIPQEGQIRQEQIAHEQKKLPEDPLKRNTLKVAEKPITLKVMANNQLRPAERIISQQATQNKPVIYTNASTKKAVTNTKASTKNTASNTNVTKKKPITNTKASTKNTASNTISSTKYSKSPNRNKKYNLLDQILADMGFEKRKNVNKKRRTAGPKRNSKE